MGSVERIIGGAAMKELVEFIFKTEDEISKLRRAKEEATKELVEKLIREMPDTLSIKWNKLNRRLKHL
jgi:hypothetical protein